MSEKFDLALMMKEIEEDEKIEYSKNRKMTQKEIQKLVHGKETEEEETQD